MIQISERWKHALSAIKTSPPKKGWSFTLILSFLVPNPTQQRKATNSATPGGWIFIHWFIEPWVLLLPRSLKTKRALDFSPRNLGLFSFRSKIPTFHVQRPRGSILFLAKVSLTSSWFFVIFLHNQFWSQVLDLLLLFTSLFWWVMAVFEWKVCFFLSFAIVLTILNGGFLCNIHVCLCLFPLNLAMVIWYCGIWL